MQVSSKRFLFLITLVVSQTFCLAENTPSSGERRTWGASHIRELAPDGKKTRLALFDVSQGSEHLLGTLSLARQAKGEDVQLIIKGHYNDLGEFTPNVTLAVSDSGDGDWKTIES